MTEFERDVIEGLAELKQGQYDLRRELLGNGQPGKIQILERKVEAHGKFIENWKGRAAMISAAVAAGLTLLFAIAKEALAKAFK